MKSGEAEFLPERGVWRFADIVLKPVGDKKRALWTSKALAYLVVPELRVGRPVRSSDGRSTVANWSASRYVSGSPELRYDEVVLVALKLHRATVDFPRPDFIDERTDFDAIADRMAWEEAEVPLDETNGGRWFEVLAGARKPVRLPNQVVHGDLLASVLFDGDEDPGLVDFTPYYRPAEWGAAVVAVDALIWGGAGIELLHRWSHLPDWSQLLLRAMLFRLAANAMNPRATRAALDGLRAASREVSELV